MQSYDISTCKLCKSKDLSEILSLKDSPLCDEYLKTKNTQVLYPLALNLCNICGFIQLTHVVPPEIIYKNYIYITTSSPGLKTHFQKYAEDVSNNLIINKDSLIVDIGSNDGTLLSYFKQYSNNVIGVEPSNKASEIANNNNIKTYCNFFNKILAEEIIENHKKADVITINNLFANIVDLNEFIENIKILLDEEGVLIIESSYAFEMIDNMVFDFIYHEHLSYLSVKPIRKWLSTHGLVLFNITKVETKGGSLRYYIARKKSSWKIKSGIINKYDKEPSDDILKNLFLNFKSNIINIKNELHYELEKYKGKRIVGYGASATSTTMISEFELYNYIDFLVDDNEAKINTFSPGFHLPVLNPKELLANPPDLIIILAWRFADQIKEKLAPLNIPIIIPLPKIIK